MEDYFGDSENITEEEEEEEDEEQEIINGLEKTISELEIQLLALYNEYHSTGNGELLNIANEIEDTILGLEENLEELGYKKSKVRFETKSIKCISEMEYNRKFIRYLKCGVNF